MSKRRTNGELDLSGSLVVTPGARAGRILDSLISEEARKNGLLYTPPQFLTPGRLVAALYDIPENRTPAMHERLAWAKALRQMTAAELAPLIKSPPKRDQAGLWARYAELLSRTCTLLAGENIRPIEVPALARARKEFLVVDIDDERWNALESVLRAVESTLSSCNLSLASSIQLTTVRIGTPPRNPTVILVAVSELAGLARAALMKHNGVIESHVGAPASLAASFDHLGCVIPSQWTAATADIPEESLFFADTPASQARAVFSSLAQLSPAPAPQDIVISAPDTGVTPHLIALSHEIGGVHIRDAAAVSLSSAPTCALIQSITDFCEDRTFTSYAKLIRHPHLENRLTRLFHDRPSASTWLNAMDEYAALRAPAGIDPTWTCADARVQATLIRLYRGVSHLLDPVLDRETTLPPDRWAQAIRDLLKQIYGHRRIKGSSRAGRRTMACIHAVASALDSLASTPLSLLSTPLHAVDALQLLLDELADQQLSPEPVADSIEVLGWLDAAIDPAPVAIVTGLNEGIVPEKVSADPLLPESVATALGISCNATRFGRDAYLLALIRHSRKLPGTAAVFITGRRNAEDDPLWPSRLLLPDQSLMPRIKRYLDRTPPLAPVRHLHTPSGTTGFRIRPVDDVKPPTRLSVSNFKQYLRSPYEFYLDKVLGLRELSDAGEELDPGSFGNLIHSALKLFGDSTAKSLADAAKIEQALSDSLDSHVASAFGSEIRPEVQIQIELARRRISHIARIEADRRTNGWTIEHCEWNDGRATFASDDAKIEVHGRIDRIDRNTRLGQWEIIDYKTSDAAKGPDSTHYAPRSEAWKDLQLPLYKILAAHLTGKDPVVLSYLLLPRDPKETSIQPLTSKIDLAGADTEIKRVISEILACSYSDAGSSTADKGARGALLGIGLVDDNGIPPPLKEDPE